LPKEQVSKTEITDDLSYQLISAIKDLNLSRVIFKKIRQGLDPALYVNVNVPDKFKPEVYQNLGKYLLGTPAGRVLNKEHQHELYSNLERRAGGAKPQQYEKPEEKTQEEGGIGETKELEKEGPEEKPEENEENNEEEPEENNEEEFEEGDEAENDENNGENTEGSGEGEETDNEEKTQNQEGNQNNIGKKTEQKVENQAEKQAEKAAVNATEKIAEKGITKLASNSIWTTIWTAIAPYILPVGGAILAIIVIVIIIIVVFGLIFRLGKSGNEPIRAYENRGEVQLPLSLTKEEELKKALEEDPAALIKNMETIKKNATGKNKDQIIQLCDQIIEQANILKEKGQAQKVDKDQTDEANAKIKGEKETAKAKIYDLIKKLVPLLYSCDEYNLKNKTFSKFAGVYFYELPRPNENGFPDYTSSSSSGSQYGTAEFICWLGNSIKDYNQNFKVNFPNLLVNGQIPWQYKVRIGDLSLPSGGPMGNHDSHQYGEDADLVIWNGVYDAGSEYNQKVAALLIDALWKYGKNRTLIIYDDQYFLDKKLTVYWSGHFNHFHVRLKYKQ